MRSIVTVTSINAPSTSLRDLSHESAVWRREPICRLVGILFFFFFLLISTTCGQSDLPIVITDTDYAIISRKVSTFCVHNCGGPCEVCCDHYKYYEDENVKDTICLGRSGKERDICYELVLNLDFICRKASYKYVTNEPYQEFKSTRAMVNDNRPLDMGGYGWKRGLESISTVTAVGMVNARTTPLVTTIEKKKRGNDDDKPSYQPKYEIFNYEIYICGTKKGAVHYTAVYHGDDDDYGGEKYGDDGRVGAYGEKKVLPFWVYANHYDDSNDHRRDGHDHTRHSSEVWLKAEERPTRVLP